METQPLGTRKAHHMPDDYYVKWQSLRDAERRAELNYLRNINTQTAQKFAREMRRLTDHENAHNTL